MGWTVTPKNWSGPAFSVTEDFIPRKADRTDCGSCKFNLTPPTSVLCVIVSEKTFSTSQSPTLVSRLRLRFRRSGFDRRNSVIRQDLFRFEFCEEHPPSGPGLIDNLCRAAPTARPRLQDCEGMGRSKRVR